jgi:hypothetical protein
MILKIINLKSMVNEKKFEEVKQLVEKISEVVKSCPEKIQEKCFDKLFDLFIDASSVEKSFPALREKLKSLTPSVADYQDIFAVEDEKIKLIIKTPGGDKRDRTIKTALLLVFANNSVLNRDSIKNKEIIDACKHQSCLDSNNFASAIKSAANKKTKQEYFIVGKDKDVKLTKPGEEEAKKLIEEIRIGLKNE